MTVNNALNTGTVPLPVSSGGTGLATLTNHALQIGATTSTPTQLVLGAGQLPIGTTSGDPSAAALTAGTGILISSVSGAITISATGDFGWTAVTGTTQQMVVNTNYIANSSSGAVVFTLPTTSAVGDILRVVGLGSSGWSIAQNASQLIHVGSLATTTGTGGSVASSNAFDCMSLVCVVANTTWTQITAPQGNITVT